MLFVGKINTWKCFNGFVGFWGRMILWYSLYRWNNLHIFAQSHTTIKVQIRFRVLYQSIQKKWNCWTYFAKKGWTPGIFISPVYFTDISCLHFHAFISTSPSLRLNTRDLNPGLATLLVQRIITSLSGKATTTETQSNPVPTQLNSTYPLNFQNSKIIQKKINPR